MTGTTTPQQQPAPQGEVIDYPRGATFESAWAMIQDYAKISKENEQKYEKMHRETERIIGRLGNRFGELIEHLIVPNMTEKFNELGFDFSGSLQNWEIREPGNPDASAEIDVLLENGDIAVAIEIKSKPNQNDVDEHLRRMEIVRRVADRRGDRRKFQGGIAGAIMSDSVRAYALKNGLYVVEQTGDTVRIVTSEGFKPREW
jgi:hypothetical protein